MTEDEVRYAIRSYAEKAGSVRALAKEWGISQAYLDKQIRGDQAVGDMVLRKMKLVRRKIYEFYPEDKALDVIAKSVGLKIRHHDSWRDAQGCIQREAGHGAPMTIENIAQLMGISVGDLERALAYNGFPQSDAEIGEQPAWRSETIYGWLRRKARRVKVK